MVRETKDADEARPATEAPAAQAAPSHPAADRLPVPATPAAAAPLPGEEPTELTPFEGDAMDVTIQVAAKLAEYEKALDTIIGFMIRRTYPGDWVCHDRGDVPFEFRTANIGNAAAERVARDLGVTELNKTQPVKYWHGEKHPGHYFYKCEGDFEFRRRRIHATGIASTLNPFYSRAGGSDKDPADIREEYIERECTRDLVKQAVRHLFGLRKVPLTKLMELGYDITKVRFVNYKSGKDSQAATNAEATAVPADVAAAQAAHKPTRSGAAAAPGSAPRKAKGPREDAIIAEMKFKAIKWRTHNGTSIADIVGEDGVIYSWWRKEATDPDIAAIAQAIEDGAPVSFSYTENGRFKNFDALIEVKAL